MLLIMKTLKKFFCKNHSKNYRKNHKPFTKLCKTPKRILYLFLNKLFKNYFLIYKLLLEYSNFLVRIKFKIRAYKKNSTRILY